jgi:hypothetical protein
VSKRFVTTLTIPLPDDVIEQARLVSTVSDVIDKLRSEMGTVFQPEQYEITTSVVAARVERGPRQKRDPAPEAAAKSNNGKGQGTEAASA